MLTREEKVEIKEILCDINRKLLLLKGEKSSSKRSEIIDFIVLDKKGELERLSKTLKIKVNK